MDAMGSRGAGRSGGRARTSTVLLGWLVALLALAVASCSSPPDPTQLVIRVSTNMAYPGELQGYRIRVRRQGAPGVIHDAPYDLRMDGAVPLPADLGIVASGPDDGRRVEVEVTADLPEPTTPGTPTSDFTVRATVSFRPERSVLLDIFLARECTVESVRRACEAMGQTCGRGGLCVGIVREDLPEILVDGAVIGGDTADAGAAPDASDASDASDAGDARLPDVQRPDVAMDATMDAGMDAGMDAAMPPPDVAIDTAVPPGDVAMDTAMPGMDAGMDAAVGMDVVTAMDVPLPDVPTMMGMDAGMDVPTIPDVPMGMDAPPDVPMDVAMDAGMDVAMDAGMDVAMDAAMDMGVDMGVDAGMDVPQDDGFVADTGIFPDVGTDVPQDDGFVADTGVFEDVPEDIPDDGPPDDTGVFEDVPEDIPDDGPPDDTGIFEDVPEEDTGVGLDTDTGTGDMDVPEEETGTDVLFDNPATTTGDSRAVGG